MQKLIAILGLAVLVAGCQRDDRPARAKALVRQWTENLDGRIAENGLYVHHQGATDDDPWGHPLHVSYSQGGATETLTVRSAGPDGLFYSDDDFVEQRSRFDAKALGKNITKAIAEPAEEGAKRVMMGAIDGVKEGLKKKPREKGDKKKSE